MDFKTAFDKCITNEKFYNKVIRTWTKMQKNPYHVVTKSPWPMYVSLSLGISLFDVVRTFCGLVYVNVWCSGFFFFFGFCIYVIIRHFKWKYNGSSHKKSI